MVKGGGFRKKTGGIDFDEGLTLVQQPNLQANFQPKLLPNIVYKQNVFTISQSATLTALFTKESRVCGLVELLIYRGKTV